MDKVIYEKMRLPKEVAQVLECGRVVIPNSREEIFSMAFGPDKVDIYDVEFDVNGKITKEATVTRCKNGVSVNFDEAYMRRRDPNCMVIGDDLPTDKAKYIDRFGEKFDSTRTETLEWLAGEELIVMPFYSGNNSLKSGYDSLLIAPINTAFFAAGLLDLQGFVRKDDILEGFEPKAIVYVAPPFRHTHYNGKQVVVHNRLDGLHEVFSYNLYPGPSAKKGIYGVLLNIGEKEKWVTCHASAVTIVTPYELTLTIMHEGASGGGKSEMLERHHRQENGQLLFATNLVDDEEYHMTLSDDSALYPVTDDMASANASLQNGSKKLVITDAEDGWFLRVDHIENYGTEPGTEKNTIHPERPLVFFNIDGKPNATALIWEPIEDEPGKPCPNPRVIMPRSFVQNHIDEPVEVDVRSFGLRQPPSTADKPSYGIAGLFHVLPPALAWLWRLVAPRGFANPSIVDTGGMKSEGVGSYWPFATGRKVDQANLLLQQIIDTPNTKYVLIPNQHIGAYKVGFSGQWVTREYLSRRGGVNFKMDALEESRCPLLGYSPKKVKVDGIGIRRRFLRTHYQSEFGIEGYDAGAKMLTDFFKSQLQEYLIDGLDPLGRKIIEACLNDATVEEYFELMPYRFK
ncbi:MAG: DUF4914 family protein [Lachnospirales bacterium]